jgi:hypothetical protein
MSLGGNVGPAGTVEFTRLAPAPFLKTAGIWKNCLPWFGLGSEVNKYRAKNFRNVWRGLWRHTLANMFGIPTFTGVLQARRFYPDGRVVDLGVVSVRVVTTVGAGYIVDAFQNLVELENMRFHGFGTGGGAEAVGDTALTTELTTQYVADNTRPTGSQTENGATVFRTVATLDPDADVALTEHGIFSQAATGGGVLLDRSLYAAINLTGTTGDALQVTYDFTVNTGG